jgi:hypothetical protein
MLKSIPAPNPEQIQRMHRQTCLRHAQSEVANWIFPRKGFLLKLKPLVDVWIGTGTTLDDTRRTMSLGLPDKRATINWHFWRRYERFLEEESGTCTP